MKISQISTFIIAAAIVSISTITIAQTSKADLPVSRTQIKMERDDFLKTHEWDDTNSNWIVRAGVEPPMGVKSRAEVKAMRDKFLSNNKWNKQESAWVPLKPGPRDLSGMTREEVRAETVEFMRTHAWDENKEDWLLKAPMKK
jgi:hypothetical protein